MCPACPNFCFFLFPQTHLFLTERKLFHSTVLALPYINMSQSQVYMCPLPLELPSPLSPSYPSWLLQGSDLNTANSHWVSILYMVVYMLLYYSLPQFLSLLAQEKKLMINFVQRDVFILNEGEVQLGK